MRDLGPNRRPSKNIQHFAAWHDADRRVAMCQGYRHDGAFIQVHLKMPDQVAGLAD